MAEPMKIPGPDATAEEWGRLAVSLPGWRWSFPWASLPDEDGRVWRRNWCPSDSGFGWSQVAGPPGSRPTFEAIDPDDPATAGCLLALLRSGCRVWQDREDGLWTVKIGGVRASMHASLGRACIAAATALDRWPGGEE